MAEKTDKLLTYDPRGTFWAAAGENPRQLQQLAARLVAARRELLQDSEAAEDPVRLDPSAPVQATLLDLPDAILGQYEMHRTPASRPTTVLARILRTAERLRETGDRVLVLARGPAILGPKALVDACCDPYFNELNRAERGSRPRLTFVGNHLDNDAIEGLRRLLGNGQPARHLQDRWSMIAAIHSADDPKSLVGLRHLLAILQSSCPSPTEIAERVVTISDLPDRWEELAPEELGCRDTFSLPPRVSDHCAVLSAMGLLPAAVVGLNVVRFLEGARRMSQHFRTAAPEQNSILRHAAVRYRARHAAATRCVLRIWSRALETVGPWYADLAGTSLVGAQAIPVTVVNASELAATGTSSGPEQDGTWTTDLIPEHPQWDPLSDLAGNRETGRWAGPVGGTVPELLRSRYRETVRADRRAGRPVASIRLPAVDEFYLGQLMQLLMLATTIEERLLRSDANGRPEVQALDNHLTLTGI